MHLVRRRLFGWYVRLLTSFSFGGVQGRSTPVGSAAAPFGWHRPPTAHRATAPWTCGTGRHRVTGQRYALAPAGSNHRAPARGHVRTSLWMNVLPRAPRRLVTFAPPRFPATPGPPRSRRPCDPRHSRRKAALTCGNVVQRPRGWRLGQALSTRSGPVHSLWTKLWTDPVAAPERRAPRHDQTKAGTRGAAPRRTSTRPGAASSTTSSPTSGPGCAPASRSRCTRAPRSSPCPTTSPAASSRAGCAASSRTR